MDELSRKFRSIDWKALQKSARKVQASTASALKDMVMTDLENKTRAATADTSWGASGSDLMAIAHGTYRREDYALIMSIVWQRLASSRRRCVYKALELLKFLIMHGAGRCTEEARAALPHLQALTNYMATDEHGRDVGEGVRNRATLVCQMLSDEQTLEEERARSRDMRAKLQGGADAPGGRIGGLSSDDYRFNHGFSQSHQHSNYSSHNVTSTSTGGGGGGPSSGFGGTATFKGYGDDDPDDSSNPGSRYDDDVPTNQFAQRAKNAAAVDDLLGGGGDEQSQASPQDGQQQQQGGTGTEPSQAVEKASGTTATGMDDLLSDLNGLNVSAASASNAESSSSSNANGHQKAIPTSQLVLQLAAERQKQLVVHPQQQPQPQPQQDLSQTAAVVSTATEGADLFAADVNDNSLNLSSVQSTTATAAVASPTNPQSPSGAKPTKVLSRVTEKEKDPFADLLSSGKESGML